MNAVDRRAGWVAPEQSTPLETLAVIALATIVLLGLLVWAAGELSGRLFGGAWPHLGAGQLGTVLIHLAEDKGDPARAWPPASRRLIPGPLAFYGTLAILCAPIVTVAIAVLTRRSRSASAATASVARWARRRELGALHVRRPTAGRLTLGRVGRQLVAAEPRQSVIVVGPVQTGKTTGFAIPAILEWQGPVVATSVKTDLLQDTIAARAAIPDSELWVYDPTGGTGIPSCGWTPVAGCESWRGAQQTAAWLSAAVQRGGGIENPEFWYAAAAKLIAPLLYAAACSEQSIGDVVRWIDTQEQEEVTLVLEEAGEPGALTAFEASTFRDERTRSSIYTTAETALAAYADPGVLATALTSDLRPERLLDGGHHTAYLCAPAHEQRRLRPLFATVVQQIIACAYTRASAGPLNPPLLLVLDECANIAPLRDLATLASTSAGQGIQLVSVFQDMAQITTVYGRDQAPTIVSNHRAKVVLSGIADTHTLDYLNRLLGDQQIQHTSTTRGASHASTTDSTGYRPLAPGNLLRQLRPGHGLLVYGHLPPSYLTLRPWFKNRRLRKLAAGALP